MAIEWGLAEHRCVFSLQREERLLGTQLGINEGGEEQKSSALWENQTQ